ncbi:MAG: nucleotidyltransferase [Syntrophales bacterium]|nr:nucleotidyltransferase [Syntrophales bacterium]
MFDKTKKQLSKFMERLSDALDIPEAQFKEAVERYQAVGKWLNKEDSKLHPFEPEIYPQGSFRLGTVVKPTSDEDEYDIDLVCELNLSSGDVTQKRLKKMVGDRLKDNKTYEGMLDKEGRRCWTLNYADGSKFHLDILPSVPDDINLKEKLQILGVPKEWTEYAICITDNTSQNYDSCNDDWPRSNPKGYAAWFKEQMKTQYEARKMLLAEEMRISIEDVPEYRVKTPLQRAIQILKRHRDIMFENDQEHKPISIIITTLAAHSYNNEADLFDAITNIVKGMPHYIRRLNGAIWIPNPVNPDENFGDKWNENPKLEESFRNWLLQVQSDLDSIMKKDNIREISESMKFSFGMVTVQTAFSAFGSSNLKVNDQIPEVKIQNPSKPWRQWQDA